LNDIFADVDALPGELAFEIIDTSPANILPGIQLAGSNGDHLEIDAGNSVVGTTAVTLAAMDQAGATGFYEIELQIARIFAPISGVADDMTFQHLNPQTLRELARGRSCADRNRIVGGQ
jgi:hypothetical protein